MIKNYLTNITPDSFSGMIFACEGIKKAVVLLNGPTGCKFYHGAIASYQGLAQREFDAVSYSDLWLFGQARVPCTYLDKRDYVYGSRDKILDGIKYIKEVFDCEFLAIINSPGAALIGDDLEGISEIFKEDFPILTIESPGYSQNIWDGYSDFTVELIKKLIKNGEHEQTEKHEKPEKVKNEWINVNSEKTEKTVNILGMSIFQKYYRGDVEELKKIFELCGVKVNCVLCANCNVEEIKNMGNADLNVVIHKDYGLKAALCLEELCGTPYYACDCPPIGFSQTEKMVKDVCEMLNCDFENFRSYSERARSDVYLHLSRLNSLTGLPKGVKFAVHGRSEECLAYAQFFVKHFAMIAECISVIGDEDLKTRQTEDYIKLESFLESYGMKKAMEQDILLSKAELVFANGDIIAQLKARKHSFSGIETGLPSLGYTDVLPKTHLGVQGAKLLCEQIINGVLFFGG